MIPISSKRIGRASMTVLGVLVCALVGCASPNGGSSANSGGGGGAGGTSGGDTAPRLQAGPPAGAVLAERETSDTTSLFRPLELPPATEVRLGSGAPGPAYWQQQADYVINATLDVPSRRVSATGRITYHNHSPHTLDFVWLHLEQNLFASDSRGALSKPMGSRFGMREGIEGGFTIERIGLASGKASSWHEVGTLGRLDLSEPMKPGDRIEIDVAWSFPVPQYGADRMGTEDLSQGVVFQLAQWFPAMVKYDDVNGWQSLEYMGAGEFYTDFGRYEVNITVPATHMVAAAGVLMNPQEVLSPDQQRRLEEAKRSDTTVFIRRPEEVGVAASGTRTWRFVAEDVRSFAWASSEAFIWDAASVEVQRADGPARVLCQSFYPKEGQPLWEKSTAMTQHSIRHYSRMWYPYPWPSAINVNGIVGGMEYPMIVFCRARQNEQALFGVTDHEFGHQWFPFIVNTDERRFAWMDEGMNSFINIYSNREWWNDGSAFRRANRSPAGIAELMAAPNQQPIMTRPDFIFGGNLGYLAYGKPAVGLYLLREVILGQELFDRAFKAYIDRWAFKSPQPADFFRTMEDVSGTDLGWFWRGWFYGTGTLDQSVTAIEQETNDEGTPGWVRVTLSTTGGVVMPVLLEARYEDGSTERRRLPAEIWATTDSWVAGWNPQGRLMVEVVIDPDNELPDVDRTNNRLVR